MTSFREHMVTAADGTRLYAREYGAAGGLTPAVCLPGPFAIALPRDLPSLSDLRQRPALRDGEPTIGSRRWVPQ